MEKIKTVVLSILNVLDIKRFNKKVIKKFPDTLKLSDIRPAYLKLDPSDKANYRPAKSGGILSFIAQ